MEEVEDAKTGDVGHTRYASPWNREGDCEEKDR
jgi:hypothetical protein